MDYTVSHIQVAGAGAGKTFGLADQIVKRNKEVRDHKNIIAITYTNAAKKNIKAQLSSQMGTIPYHISVMTVHSFLLEKLIFPYSNIVLGKSFKKAISIPLPDKPQFKNWKLRCINERNIVHNHQVFKMSQMILNKKGKNKNQKNKIDIIINHIISSIDSIFVDESQDLDDDALNVFKVLSDCGLYIYMVGDPKQAIKFPKSFENFCNDAEKGSIDTFILLDNINTSRRVPSKHLNFSNQLCKKNQRQNSLNEKPGKLSYIFVSDSKFQAIYDVFKANNDLVYINKKNENFNTQLVGNNLFLPESVVDKLREKCLFEIYDFDVWIKSIIIEFENNLSKITSWSILKQFEKKYGIKLEKNEWAELNEILTLSNSNHRYSVSSIDKIKGLESDKCMFVVDNSMMQYLTGKNKKRNKESNRLYVALTRSSDELVFALDDERITCMSNQEIIGWCEHNEIEAL